jgi:uncharacterized membrane protein
MQAATRAGGTVGIFPETIAGALAYVTVFPAIVFLLLDPYNKNRFVRFHSFQCIFLWVAGLLLGALLRFVGFILFIIPILGHLLLWLISAVAVLGGVVLWLVLVVKALQGEMFRLPVLGDAAEQKAADL